MRINVLPFLALLLTLAGRGAAQAQDQDDSAAAQIEAARQLLQSGAQMPPEASKYLEAHPELKEQLIEGAKKKAEEESKDKPKPRASKAAGPANRDYENPGPAAPRYDWQRSPYLASLFAKRLSPQEKQELVHFGHELFDPRPGGASVLEDMPVSPSYVLGPGDQIIVKTWGRLEGTNRMTVDREGRIFYPKIGSIYVAGKTFGELKTLLQGKIGKIAEVKFEVSLGELKASRVSVVGEVRTPGWYNVSSLHTALQALYLAGGVKDIGSMRKIELRRGGGVGARIDLYDFLLRGNNRGDIRLLPGDTIFVPVAGSTIAVVGDVRRPAIYELSDEKTLLSAIRMAGDFSAAAYTRRVQVERLDAHKASIVLDVEMGELEHDTDKFQLQDGDVVRVLRIVDTDENVLTVEGNVRRPGRYEVKAGLTVGRLFPDPDAFLPETWFDYALLTRLVPPDLHKELIAVDLRAIVLEHKQGADVAFRGRDTLKVFPRAAFKDPRRVTISGEVRMSAPSPQAKEEAAHPEAASGVAQMEKPAPASQRANAERSLAEKQASERQAFEKELAAHALSADQRQLAHRQFAAKQSEEKQATENRLAESQSARKDNAASTGGSRALAHDSDVLTFEIPEGARLSDVVTLAGGLSRDALLSRAEIVRVDVQRNLHTIYVDLGKAMAGDPDNNVLLQDEDRVRIHSIWETKVRRTVSASGELRDPGDYLLTDGMKLTDLIFKAGGFTESAYGGQAELVRRQLMPDGSLVKTQTLVISPTRAMEGDTSADLVLQPYDQLVVRQIPDWMARFKVTLIGEVRFPGVYAVPKGERLSAVVARAGGFTPEAYLHATQFTRESTRQTQQAAIDRLAEELELSIAEKAQEAPVALDKEDIESNREAIAARKSLVNQLRLAKALGRVIIHLPEDAKIAGSPADILLEDKDRLDIPKKMNVVNVVGRVYNPTGIVFEADDSKARHYLEAAGGPMESADADHIFILRADGSVATGSHGIFGRGVLSADLQPGDSVIVPEKLLQPRFLKDFRDITQIIFQLALSTAVVLRL